MLDLQKEPGKREPVSIGIDIGGSNTRLGLFHSLDTPHFTTLEKFPTSQHYEQQLQSIMTAIQSKGLTDLAGIGVSIAGRIAKDGRSVVVAPNLPEYIARPFAQQLSDRFGCPTRLAHDAVCGLLAEKRFGSIQHFDRCAYLTVSTGTGAAIQLAKAGHVLTSSIEIGHQILDGNQRVCLCGQVGCLETFTGGKQIALRYGCSAIEITDTSFWEDFCTKLALGLVNLAMLSRIDAVAISGAIILNNRHLLARIQQHVNAMIRGSTLELGVAQAGEDAPIIGAALLHSVPEETILH
jgi:glucokinase